MQFKVMSFNIHKGRAFFSRRRTWNNFRHLLEKLQPDLIFLQEFLVEKEAEHLLQDLVSTMWPHSFFGPNAVASSGYHYGNAIVSRYPLLETKNTDISNSQLQRRGLLYSRIQPKEMSKPLHLFCCHLDLTHAGRVLQVKQMQKILPQFLEKNEPFLMAGDFNDWSERLHKRIEKTFQVREVFADLTGRLQPSAPSVYPLFSLDRIYFHKLAAIRATHLARGLGSDHMALLAEFTTDIYPAA